ncbi:MAG: ABC transporter permease [Acidobacteria bacterium]|nr:ABC transporter permease [Acidobacteriota bacterium]
MRFLALSARKDLLRILRDPIALLTWIALPIIMNGMMALIFREGDPMPQGKLLFVDQDQTLVSGLISSAFSREPLSRMILVERMDEPAARKRIDAGDASAMLIVPKGFSDAFFQRKQSTLTLVKNPSARIVPEMIQQAVDIVLEGAFYLQRVLGPDFDRFTSGPPSDLAVAAMSVRTNQLMRQFSYYIDPPLIDLETKVIQQQKKRAPFPVLFFPGMLMLALFGLAVSRSEDIWRERAQGTLRRALATPQNMASYFGGKVLALGAVTALIGALGLVLARYALSAEIHNPAAALLWAPCAGMSFYVLNIIIQLAASDPRSGVMLSMLILFICGMIGGSFFPFEMMPAWLAAIGRFAPNGWLVLRFKEMLQGPIDPVQLFYAFGTLVVLNGIAFYLICVRLRKWSVA